MRVIPILLIPFVLMAACTDRVPQAVTYATPLEECPDTPNCFLSTYVFQSSDSGQVLLDAQAVIESDPRTEILSTSANSLHATYRIAIFGWVDDVHIHTAPGTTDGTVFLHIRSASRVGNSDLGANERRANRIIRKLSYKYRS